MNELKIVFVCLGNYFRSPMAEAIFSSLAKNDGLLNTFNISSAGTEDWDVGHQPDPRTCKILNENNYALDPQKRARMISAADIEGADYIVCMSRNVALELGNGKNVFLLLDFVDGYEGLDVPDPYPTDTFPQAFEMIEKGVKAFYAYMKKNLYTKRDGSALKF